MGERPFKSFGGAVLGTLVLGTLLPVPVYTGVHIGSSQAPTPEGFLTWYAGTARESLSSTDALSLVGLVVTVAATLTVAVVFSTASRASLREGVALLSDGVLVTCVAGATLLWQVAALSWWPPMGAGWPYEPRSWWDGLAGVLGALLLCMLAVLIKPLPDQQRATIAKLTASIARADGYLREHAEWATAEVPMTRRWDRATNWVRTQPWIVTLVGGGWLAAATIVGGVLDCLVLQVCIRCPGLLLLALVLGAGAMAVLVVMAHGLVDGWAERTVGRPGWWWLPAYAGLVTSAIALVWTLTALTSLSEDGAWHPWLAGTTGLSMLVIAWGVWPITRRTGAGQRVAYRAVKRRRAMDERQLRTVEAELARDEGPGPGL